MPGGSVKGVFYNKEGQPRIVNEKLAVHFMTEPALPNEVFVSLTNQQVPNIEPYYCISNYGRIWHKYRDRMLKPTTDKQNNTVYVLSRKDGQRPATCRAHRLVMSAFRHIDGCEDMNVIHKDGDNSNNTVCMPDKPDNLIWVDTNGNQYNF